MVMLAMVERCVHLDEPVLPQRTVQSEGVRGEYIDVSEPPPVLRVERGHLGSLQEQDRPVPELTYALEKGCRTQGRERRRPLLGGERLRNRLAGPAAAAGSERSQLVCQHSVDRRAVDERSDGGPERGRISHVLE
jgi:hypothetical protein